jgi:hypothetical protein
MSEALGISAELRNGFTAGKQGLSPERQDGQRNVMSWGVLSIIGTRENLK